MGNKIVVNDGFKTYDICNQNDKVLGQFSFNPSDTNIIKRYNNLLQKFERGLFDIDKESEDYIEEFDKIVYTEVNNLLNSDDAAESLFSVMGPLSPANGEFYLYTALDAIKQAIEIETGERMKKINGKINKHTSKYHG